MIKNMNSKMTTNSQLPTTEPKKQKLSKQPEQEQNQRNGHHMEDYQQGSGRGREGGKVQRMSSINGRQKIRQGEGENSIGNVEAKELICMTHGPELKGQEMRIEGDCRTEGNKGGENGTTVIA